MKTVVCREDIKAELDMLQDMKFRIQILEGQVQTLQDRVSFLEQKSAITSVNTSVNVPERITTTTDVPHMYWGEALSNAAERIQQDGHWDINDDGTLTFVRD